MKLIFDSIGNMIGGVKVSTTSASIPVLIPAWNPDEKLIVVINGLLNCGCSDIIIVDDGSNRKYQYIFDEINKIKECHLLRHAVNLGKGRALKTGLNYFYLNFPASPGIVTADADGQHKPEDIIKTAEHLVSNPDKLILGIRKFSNKIPFRSMFGNILTKYVFLLFMGKMISDTQSGLRGIPRFLVPRLLKLAGEQYEYEINMLISAVKNRTGILEVPIDTIYIDNNKSSHFKPVTDSIKIYRQLFRHASPVILPVIVAVIILLILIFTV